eukprot:CAMPEP_0174932410 /NCGR_PEP_ID=MMETSP1355-20121228/35686_1 /TAXON_ID=464990 /ORGANISM="Hemiselmis tepida, Strain CCMP443" /LENGTH=136 /DNA_ID=CAMNT_0016178819 /DNA_START=42 /DNA_END=452 /DNA_ORIENTATION=+
MLAFPERETSHMDTVMHTFPQYCLPQDQALQNVEDMLQHLTMAPAPGASIPQQTPMCGGEATGGPPWGGQDICMEQVASAHATPLAEAVSEYAHVYYSSEWSGGSACDEHDDGTGAAFHAQMQWCIEHNLEVSRGF